MMGIARSTRLAAAFALAGLLAGCGWRVPFLGIGDDEPVVVEPALENQDQEEEPAAPPPAAPDDAAPVAAADPAAPLPDTPTDEELLRALKRSLVQEGLVVLPPFAAEIEPEVSYTYRVREGLTIINADGQQVVADEDRRRDTLEASLSGRLGLPWRSQVSVTVPYEIDTERTVLGGDAEEDDASGLGDITLSLTKQLRSEGEGWPALLAGVGWKTTTGDAEFGPNAGLSVGTGFHSVQGNLVALTSRDPLVFFSALSYQWTLEDEKLGRDIDPGDTFGLRLGTALAASPDTSLRLAADFDFTHEAEVDGGTLDGSDAVSAVLELGVSATIAPRTLLDVTVGAGLTDDSPDFILSASLPIRF